LKREWIPNGAHINAIGTHSPASREIDGATMAAARVFVDKKSQRLMRLVITFRSQEASSPDSIVGEIGELLIGTKQGRRSSDEITLFKSLGLAVEDPRGAVLV
jgi:ornithine cyclodeaminase